MLRVSSPSHYRLYWVYCWILIPIWVCGGVMAVIGGMLGFASQGGWGQIVGCSLAGLVMLSLLIYLAGVGMRFIRRLRGSVWIDAATRCIQVRQRGRCETFPLSELARVKLHHYPRLVYVELFFSHGGSFCFIPTYIGWLEIKDQGIASWWQQKVIEAERYLPVPPPVSGYDHDQGDHLTA